MNHTEVTLSLPDLLADKIQHLARTLTEAGFECYIVGGAVRDMLLGIPVYDFDFATNARPRQLVKLFRNVIPTGIKHGTVTVLIEGEPFEVTTYRADGKYTDGRRPDDVRYSESLDEDVMRRDFTINGLAYNPLKQYLMDYVEGMEDLRKGIIRTINDPVERLSEDGLRSYRACRFASKLGFAIERNTSDAITRTLDISARVSSERVRDEIMKIMATDTPSVGIEEMRKHGLLALALPELDRAYGVEQNRFHTYDVYHHCLYSADAASATDPLLRLTALLHDIGKVPCRGVGEDGDYTFYNHEIVGARMMKALMKRLKFSNEEIDRSRNLAINHMFYYTRQWSDGAVRRFIRKVGLENLHDLLLLREADRAGNGSRSGQSQPVYELQRRIEEIVAQDTAFSVRDLSINGRDLMAIFGLPEGRLIGEILNYLLELVLDDPDLNTFETLSVQAQLYLQDKDVGSSQ